MLKLRGYEIAIGFLIATAFWAGVFVWQSSRQLGPLAATAQNASTEDPKRAADERIALYTLWLAAFTGALVVVSSIQIAFLIRADRTARMAAEAATLNAKAAIGTELPVIRMFGLDLLSINAGETMEGAYGGLVNDGLPERYSAISDVEVHNYGRTPAFPIHIEMGFSVCQILPQAPVYDRKIPRDPSAIVQPNETVHMDTYYPITLTDAEVVDIREQRAALWIYCALTYRDFLEMPHEVRFCWRWGQDPPGEGIFGFISDSSAPPEYTRKAQPKCAVASLKSTPGKSFTGCTGSLSRRATFGRATTSARRTRLM